MRVVVMLFTIVTVLSGFLVSSCLGDDSYENMVALMEDILGSKSGYNPDYRPRNRYADRVDVTVGFTLITVLEIDDVKQTFKLNGFLTILWHDERVSWNKTQYGGAVYVVPRPENIWRPRMVMVNTLGERDVFKDAYSPLALYYNGVVFWMPGGLFEASCSLNMKKYPFDKQHCMLLFCPMSYSSEHMIFIARQTTFDMSFFVGGGAWEFLTSNISTRHFKSTEGGDYLSCLALTFAVKRQSSYFLINVILPVVMLSFLNSFVFLIPNESGEKISFGITVLLSLSVFMSTVSTMVPKASDYVPAVTIYLLILLLLSVISVLKSIAAVFLSHEDEDETPHFVASNVHKQAVNNITRIRRAFLKVEPMECETTSLKREGLSSEVGKSNDGPKDPLSSSGIAHRTLTKHTNKVCFIVSMALWTITQIVYFVYATV